MIGPAQSTVRRLARRLLDMVLPPRCLKCQVLSDSAGALCPECWSKIHFHSKPCCDACGHPFSFDHGPGVYCGACTRLRPPFRRARAVFIYDDESRSLVLSFKYGDRTDAAPAYGRWMVRAGRGLLCDADLIVPVPLHWTRMWARRYNQAALLARVIAQQTGVPLAPDALKRVRRTPPQGRLSHRARWQNLENAFAVRKNAAQSLAGQRVLLIDDVMTSGATAAACARALLAGGAGSVDVLTLARAVRTTI